MSFPRPFATLPAMSKTGVFVITGAGSGIGQAIAVKIVQQGHDVIGLGRDKAKLENTSRLCGTERFRALAFNLTDSARTQEAIKDIQAFLKQKQLPLLGLVNNAGIYDYKKFVESSDSLWEQQFETNLLSAVRLTRELYPDLKAAAPRSSVLNISSTLGLRPISNTSAYSAIKAAMINWSQCLALEWAAEKIRVNCINPGIVETPLHASRQLSPEAQPLGRVGKPEDIAHAAWFLLSDESSWTTGTLMTVDGGINL